MRLLISLLLLASFASAQTVDELVDRAIRATTGPKERLETMQELLKRENGDAALAKAGLDPRGDFEVVHMTVEVLLDSGRAGPHMAAICRLLLNAGHADKIKERIYRYAENLDNGRKLVARLSVLARGSDPEAREDIELQRAAVKALGVIPHRDAVEAIAAVWAGVKEPGIKAECEIQLRGVILAKDGADAVTILGERRYATWADLIREERAGQALRGGPLQAGDARGSLPRVQQGHLARKGRRRQARPRAGREQELRQEHRRVEVRGRTGQLPVNGDEVRPDRSGAGPRGGVGCDEP
jgi:hypothetical protein